jgi:hypothetical protein
MKKMLKFVVTLCVAGLATLSVSSFVFAEEVEPQDLDFALTEVFEILDDEGLFSGTFESDPRQRNLTGILLAPGYFAVSTATYNLKSSDTVLISGFWTPGTSLEIGIAKYNPQNGSWLRYPIVANSGTGGIPSNTKYSLSSVIANAGGNGSYYYYVASHRDNTRNSSIGLTFALNPK